MATVIFPGLVPRQHPSGSKDRLGRIPSPGAAPSPHPGHPATKSGPQPHFLTVDYRPDRACQTIVPPRPGPGRVVVEQGKRADKSRTGVRIEGPVSKNYCLVHFRWLCGASGIVCLSAGLSVFTFVGGKAQLARSTVNACRCPIELLGNRFHC